MSTVTNDSRKTWVSSIPLLRPVLRVLCYHRVQRANSGRYTVTTNQLDYHLTYLAQSGFNFIHVRDLLSDKVLPERSVILTFDDGYLDNAEHALPVLSRFSAKATFFIVTKYAGDCARWDNNGAPLMGLRELRQLDPEMIELALHSHSHRAFENLSLDEISDDIRKNLEFFDTHSIPVTPALAYPYGSRPKPALRALASNLFDSLGIQLAFRVGNRINHLPLANRHEIQRIDVSGEASDFVFRRKLWIGRVI